MAADASNRGEGRWRRWVRISLGLGLILVGVGAAGQAWDAGHGLWVLGPVAGSLVGGVVAEAWRNRVESRPADFAAGQRYSTRQAVQSGAMPSDPATRAEAIRRLRRWDNMTANRWLGVGIIAFAAVATTLLGVLTADRWWWLSAAAFLVLAAGLTIDFRQTERRLRQLEQLDGDDLPAA